MTTEIAAGPLADIRVLDLAGEAGLFAGRLLGELGADVIRVEPAEGSPVRQRQPYLDDEPGLERSLYHLHFNANKRGVTLDLAQPRGVELLHRLVEVADIALETFAPGEADVMGIGFEALREQNPALIYTTVTPFGQDGPMSGYRGNDLIGAATSGNMWLNGFPEEPPVQAGSEQAYHMASLAAASGTLIALHGRDRAGAGHRVDISIQEAASMATFQHSSASAYGWNHEVPGRKGLGGLRGGRSIFQCADGLWVSFIVPPYRWPEFLDWLREEQIECELFEDAWRDPAYRIEHAARLSEVIAEVAGRHPREHVFHEGQRRRLLVTQSNAVDEVVADPQLASRDYFVAREHEELERKLVDTGAAAQLSRTPAAVRRRAPLLGEHNVEVYCDLLGLAPDELTVLGEAGVI